MTRVAGVDPGTVSFDVCVLDDGEVVLERSFVTAEVGLDPAPLVSTLVEHGPYECRARPGRLRAAARSRLGGRRARARADGPAPLRRAAGTRRGRRDAHDHPRTARRRSCRSCSGRERSTCRPSRRTASGTASTWGPRTRSRAPRSASPTRRPTRHRLRRHLVRHARARRRVHRRAGRRRRADRRRDRRLGRADRRAGVRRPGRRGGVPARRRAVEAHGVQRRRVWATRSHSRRARPRPRSR